MCTREKMIIDNIIGQLSDLRERKYPLRISDDIFLDNGMIYSICGYCISENFTNIKLGIHNALEFDESPSCSIIWKIYIPQLITNNYILNLFIDDDIKCIVIMSVDNRSVCYSICDTREHATHELFGKYIRLFSIDDITANNISQMYISEIRIVRTIDSLLLGG